MNVNVVLSASPCPHPCCRLGDTNLTVLACARCQDAYQLALDLDKALEQAGEDKSKVQLDRVLQQ
jgi:hypothetical protein